jgi:hypothetical protein
MREVAMLQIWQLGVELRMRYTRASPEFILLPASQLVSAKPSTNKGMNCKGEIAGIEFVYALLRSQAANEFAGHHSLLRISNKRFMRHSIMWQNTSAAEVRRVRNTNTDARIKLSSQEQLKSPIAQKASRDRPGVSSCDHQPRKYLSSSPIFSKYFHAYFDAHRDALYLPRLERPTSNHCTSLRSDLRRSGLDERHD